jgi:hypothetical protein
MNKRSAIVVALGLVAALVIGGVGFTMGITGPAPSLASVGQPAPKVRTVHRTVTVHRPAGSPTTVAGAASASTAGMSGSSGDWDDDGWDDEGWDDEGWDDHEGEHRGSEHETDHEGSDHGESDDD